MKNILLSSFAIVAIAVLVTAASYAAWTGELDIPDNTVSTGEVVLTLDNEGIVGELKPFTVTGLFPGQTTEPEAAGVRNGTPVPLKISMYVEIEPSENENDVCASLSLKDVQASGLPVPAANKPLTELEGPANAVVLDDSLPDGERLIVSQKATLSSDAPNETQNSNCTWTEVFVGETLPSA